MKREPRSLSRSFCLVGMVILLSQLGWSQRLDRLERELAQTMLQNVASDVRQNYYDPKFHGLDWDAKVQEAKEKIAKAGSWDDAVGNIAALLEALDDSHTVFYPPQYLLPEDYGWQFQMVGERCYITQVQPKSDAEHKGLKPGDEVKTISGFTLTRESVKKIKYVLYGLLPQSSLRVELRDPSSGKIRQVDVKTRVRQQKQVLDMGDYVGRDAQAIRIEQEDQQRLMQPRYTVVGEMMALKLPAYLMTDFKVGGLIDNARRGRGLILDLRGNPGGAKSTLVDLLGNVFDRDVKIADRVVREGMKPLTTKSNLHNTFTGKLIVLVDSESGSAAELFARVVQIEKRGTVLGDRTAGGVMEAQYYRHASGSNPIYTFGTNVSVADVLMSDGKHLEHIGVTPDETVLPSPADLASGRDPVMARAAEIAGVQLSPEEAGKLFPYQWPRNPPQ